VLSDVQAGMEQKRSWELVSGTGIHTSYGLGGLSHSNPFGLWIQGPDRWDCSVRLYSIAPEAFLTFSR
jgi:hypothetical protein